MSGVPARLLPPELRAIPREPRETIDLSLLRQTPPVSYRIDTGDVLGIYVEGILGRHEDVPPVNFPQDRGLANAIGFPIPVRDDGTISLPLIRPMSVRGMTMSEVEQAIRRAYTHGQPLLRPGRDRILVSLQKPRVYHVLVIRQEGGGPQNVTRVPSPSNVNLQKRGVGMVVALPAYQNDVLHALAQTGGLPGINAENAVYIMRRGRSAGLGKPHDTDTTRPPGELLPAPPAPLSDEGNAGGPRMSLRDWSHRAGIRPVSARTVIRGQSPDQRSTGLGRSQDRRIYGPPSGYQAMGRYGGRFIPQTPTYSPTPAPMDYAGYQGRPSQPSVRPASFERLVPEEDLEFGHSSLPNSSQPESYPEMWSASPGVPYSGTQPVLPQSFEIDDATIHGPGVLRIPLSMHPGEAPPFSEQDIILQDGDVVFVETRQTDMFYTGGLLGGGQFTLPRDHDLDVMEAILIAESEPIRTVPTRAIGGVSALNQDVTVGASEVVILRQLGDGRQVSIKVNLYDALRHPEERVIIQPGDYVFLQYTRVESVFAFIERQLFEGAVVGYATSRLYSN